MEDVIRKVPAWLIALALILFVGFIAIERYALGNPVKAWGLELKDQESGTAEKTDSIPNGAVVAFAFPRGASAPSPHCPEGWSAYIEARGRMLVGAGEHDNKDKDGDQLTEYKRWNVGGKETHTLTVMEMPSHPHNLTNSVVTAHGDQTQYLTIDRSPPQLVTAHYTGAKDDRDIAQPAGNGHAHNNMPPYIALHFCKKA